VSTPARLQMVRTPLAIRSPNSTSKPNHSQSPLQRPPSEAGGFGVAGLQIGDFEFFGA